MALAALDLGPVGFGGVRRPGQSAVAHASAPAPTSIELLPIPLTDEVSALRTAVGPPAAVQVARLGCKTEGVGDSWFNAIHVLPTSIALGNILSAQVVGSSVNTSIYNAFITDAYTLNSRVENNVDGILYPGFPSIPVVIQPQSGFAFEYSISVDGAPTLSGSVDYTFAGPLAESVVRSVPITGSRVVVIPYRPERGVRERLEFLTDVIEHIDDSEQRVAIRKVPRVFWEFTVFRAEGDELSRFDFMLFDWQARVFGVPAWHEPTMLVQAAAASATTIRVRSTAYADYRVGSLVAVFSDEATFDALEISAVRTGLSAISGLGVYDEIDVTSPLNNSYAVGDEVYPVRTAYASKEVGGSRSPRGAAFREIGFQIIDADPGDSFPDTSGFSSYDGKVLLDGPNAMDGASMEESFARKFVDVDGGAGPIARFALSDRNRRVSSKGFITKTRSELWALRRLLYALKGRQVSFYIPTFYRDLTLFQDALNGASQLKINNVGYARFVQASGSAPRSPKNLIRITRTDGTSSVHDVTAATEDDASSDTITIDPVLSGDLAVADVERIDFYEHSRLNSDSLTIVHEDSAGRASLRAPVRSLVNS